LAERDLTGGNRLLSIARSIFSLIGKAGYHSKRLQRHW